MASRASTEADDGAEECSCPDCKILTTKRFKCIVGHKAWMCSSCHRDRPVCPVALQGGSLCRAKEDDYKTDTDLEDLDSRPDSSVLLEEPFAELHELHEKVARGKYDEVLSEVNRYKAYLQLVEGKALHARAGMTFGDKKRNALRGAQDAGRESEKLLSMLPPERQEKTVRDMYAEALLLQANTGARLAAGARLAENDAMFETARCKAEKAIEFLERFASASDLGAAYRVRGAVELCRKKYQEAEGFFKLALQKFEEARQCGVHEKTEWHMWHAVSYWNMYVVKKETGKLHEAKAFLKKATQLHEFMQGGDHPYTIQYYDCLAKLQQSINPQNPIDHRTKLDLSDYEVRTIERALGIDLPESLPCSQWGFVDVVSQLRNQLQVCWFIKALSVHLIWEWCTHELNLKDILERWRWICGELAWKQWPEFMGSCLISSFKNPWFKFASNPKRWIYWFWST